MSNLDDVKSQAVASLNDTPAPSTLLNACAQAFSYPDDGIAATLESLSLVWESGDATLSKDIKEDIVKVVESSAQFEDETAEKLAYTRLFIGSLKMEAPPYASYYMTDNHTLNGRVAIEVDAVYKQFGIQLGEKEIAPADHLRYMLSFLSLLAARFEETGENAFAEAYSDFRDAFILPWYDRFQQLVEANADAPYYPALVQLIQDVLGK